MPEFNFYVEKAVYENVVNSSLPLLNNYGKSLKKIEFKEEVKGYGWMTIDIDERGLFWIGFLAGKKSMILNNIKSPNDPRQKYEKAIIADKTRY